MVIPSRYYPILFTLPNPNTFGTCIVQGMDYFSICTVMFMLVLYIIAVEHPWQNSSLREEHCRQHHHWSVIVLPPPWPSGYGRGTPWPCLKLRCAGGREFNPRPGQYSRMSFSSDQVTGKVFSSEHAFPSKFWIYLEHCHRGEAVITGHLRLPQWGSQPRNKLPFRPLLLLGLHDHLIVWRKDVIACVKKYFQNIMETTHRLNYLLPCQRCNQYDVRKFNKYPLPEIRTNRYRNSLIPWGLYHWQ